MEQGTRYKKQHNHIWTGLLMVLIGILLLARTMGAPLPEWLFTVNTGLIALGVLIGFKSHFRSPAGLILMLIGCFLSLDDWFPGSNFKQYSTPAIVILIGLAFIFRPKRRWKDEDDWKRNYRDSRRRHRDFFEENPPAPVNTATGATEQMAGEYLDSVVVFGGIEKKIVSKNFQGGEITCFMGGSEIDFSQADIQSPVILEVTQVFGGTKIIVPPHWNIKSEIVAVFAGMEDKRPANGLALDPAKTIILRGTSVFGGIEVNSFT
ncbi:LiaF transmembrane domain-containing protein [Deminuibacter soli]|uniref:LiaF transmembrane domain-containing protein n=1 Tax=Deminuibacter soli TaxID=2291815 RepID=A0A3E1NCZ5_9BACT|nr:LiaF domain-containing protein [Deminuibacter soli]RFM25810.1 hypothetical protein DXN05_22885 [Deminuibacter soli]